MSVRPARQDYFTFVAGLNTEGGWLTHVQNSWKEGDNVVPNVDGTLKKRRGMQYEDEYTQQSLGLLSSSMPTNAYTTHTWDNVAGQGNTSYYVVQVGSKLFFYSGESSVVSSGYVDEVDLTPYKLPTSTSVFGTHPVKCASANGKLLVVSKDTHPITIALVDGAFVITTLTLKMRDFDGIEDNMGVEEQLTTLSAEHRYNLYNQGWDDERIQAFFEENDYYPSNNQIWWYGKDVTTKKFKPEYVPRIAFGSTPAHKGHFVLDMLDRKYGVDDDVLERDTEDFGPTTCAFFASRAWYAGFSGTKLSNWVAFSQLTLKDSALYKCHQEADPTAEVISDLVETDGGIIPIPEAGTIIDLVPMYDGVFVFASNGVWHIKGGLGNGFSATGYSVVRISTLGCSGRLSIVSVENNLFYWNDSGIYAVGINPQSGQVEAIPLTDQSIRRLFIEIPPLGKQYAVGTYNANSKTLLWMYSNSVVSTSNYPQQYDKILAYDLRLRAFYTHSIKMQTGDPYIVGCFSTVPVSAVGTDTYVVDNSGNSVVDSSGNLIATRNSTLEGQTVVDKFVTITDDAYLTFSDMLNEREGSVRWRDWYSDTTTGSYYSSYFITGHNIGSHPTVNKTALYVNVFMNRTETGIDSMFNAVNESGVRMQVRWAFTDTAAGNKWSDEAEVYRYVRPFLVSESSGLNDGQPLVITKNKVRGRGKAVQFKFSAHEDKDMQIVGWSMLGIENGVL